MKRFTKWLSVLAALVMAAVTLTACGPNDGGGNDNYDRDPTGKVYDNENDPLIFSTLEVDRVFNPFFSTSATDSNVVGLTQISMLGNDEKGNPTYGDDEEVVVKDYEIIPHGEDGSEDQTTEYRFVLKNNVRFSNGSYLTMKDVLFNLYVYLDPAYTGSATIYSTDIVGLKEYRTQADSDEEQDAFMVQFEQAAQTRIDALTDAAYTILDEDPGLTPDEFMTALETYQEETPSAPHVVDDYEKALEYFSKELESDYSNALNSYEDTVFTDDKGVEHKGLFTTDVEQFLYNENIIQWNKKANNGDGELTYPTRTPEQTKAWTKKQAIDYVYAANIPSKIEEVVTYWMTASDLATYLTNEAMEEYFKTNTKKYTSISGIQFLNRTQSATVNGKTYAVPSYAADGHVETGNEVLSITIHKIDPKAIWNFAFSVAPMYYYSSPEQIEAFDYVSHFGVEQGSQTFLQSVVNASSKTGVPVGAGPYAASKSGGGIENITPGDFYSSSVIYFERNPYYLMGPAKVKKVRYQVTPSNQMTNSLYSHTVTFAEPNAKPELIQEIEGKRNEGFRTKQVATLGYGYIGINAGKVPTLAVRQAIMHCINTQECVDYYQNTAKNIYRSMSRESWAYPEDATAYYPYIGDPVPENLDVVNPAYAEFVTAKGKKAGDKLTEAEQKEFITGLVEGADYTLDASGVYVNGTNRLKYTFTIVGEETDHPAWRALNHAREILNKWGFNINVKTDINGLQKLAAGELTVWAAAWGATIDPDMYQVYHKDSTASSVLNWGYKQILLNAGNRYSQENRILNDLSLLIEQARETNVQSERKEIYSLALDKVMELAVELPTYQRNDLFAYDAWKLDASTLTPEEQLSAFRGLTSKIHNVSLVIA